MSDIHKSQFGLPESIDPSHKYVYREGHYGFYTYWYADQAGNYWLYSNAPEESLDYDSVGGSAMMMPHQPMPHSAPQFFTPEGYKRNIGIPDGVESVKNDNYDPTSAQNIWFEMYTDKKGNSRYVYVDADVRENLDLWVQSQLRITDAGIPAYRRLAVRWFRSDNLKDKVLGAILMLADQGFYDVDELIFATVGDVEFIDQNVKLLGRKFVCDPPFLEFFTDIVADRDPSDPLFAMKTMHGKEPLGRYYINSIFASLKVRPEYLKYWQASHIFSRIVHRMLMQNVPYDEVEDLAYNELARVFSTAEDVRFLVDVKVRDTLLGNYQTKEDDDDPEAQEVAKSLARVTTDDFGVATIWSDLSSRRKDETAFSTWLHSEPLHDMSPAEQDAAEELAGEIADDEDTEDEDEPDTGDEE